MKVFTVTGFRGINPVPTSAVVIAADNVAGARILNRELRKRRLPGLVQPDQLTEVATEHVAHAIILSDGDY